MRKNNVALVVKQLRFRIRDAWDTEIMKLNGLKSNVLYTGQVLQIP